MQKENTKKEVCLLNDSFPPLIDGVATTVTSYAEVLTERNIPVSVVTPQNKKADDSVFPYPVIRYPSIDVQKFLGYPAGNPLSVPTLLELSSRKIDILHCHCPVTSCILARHLRGILDVPMVLTYHTKFDIDIYNAIKGRILQEGAIKALVENVSSCDELWVVSKGAGENIRKLGYKGDYVVMHNGVDAPKKRASKAKVKEATKNYNLPANVPMFLFVGRIMWYKGIRIILDALAALNSQDLDFRMVFVGDGADAKEIKAYSHSLGLDKKVFFTGAIRDRNVLSAWYTRADLFLFPSTFDTHGLVVREAAACSLGSVLVRGSCAAENVTEGRNAILIDENAASLAVTLARIIEGTYAGEDYHSFSRKLGDAAADDLYLSWEDAVDSAIDRYEIVKENYKSKRARRYLRKGAEDLFEFQNDLKNLFASLEE